MPTYCTVVDTCTGHLGKFDDCLAEALYEWSLDGADETTGTSEFDGHFALILVPAATETAIDPDGENRTVPVPAGFYLVETANSGGVSLWSFDTEQEARKQFDYYDARYALYERGCDVDKPAAHRECADYDGCQVISWR